MIINNRFEFFTLKWFIIKIQNRLYNHIVFHNVQKQSEAEKLHLVRQYSQNTNYKIVFSFICACYCFCSLLTSWYQFDIHSLPLETACLLHPILHWPISVLFLILYIFQYSWLQCTFTRDLLDCRDRAPQIILNGDALCRQRCTCIVTTEPRNILARSCVYNWIKSSFKQLSLVFSDLHFHWQSWIYVLSVQLEH